MTRFKTWSLLIVLLAILPLAWVRASSQASTQTITLAPGDRLNVTCSTSLTGTIQNQSATLDCAPLPASPTPTPTPTPTPNPESPVGVCGELTHTWHAPVVNGCQTGHEHGDAPPTWVQSSPWPLMFHGHFNTSAAENTAKHTAMKGFLARFNNVDIYFRIHAASNVLDRAARFHSYEAWARDPNGGVSHWQGWYNAGDPVSGRVPRRNPPSGAEEQRPIILVVDQTAWNAGIRCEQWYATTAEWSWDFGWTICNSTTFYYVGENNEQAQSFWRPTSNMGLNRRLEASWYSTRAHPTGTFWTTQFGTIVSGPSDTRCSETTTMFGTTYQNVCLEQFIASTMRTVQFPGNAAQKTFPGTGVLLPN